MRKLLAATLLATVAFTGTPASAGCVEDYVLVEGDDTEGEPIIVRNPDGSITIYPPDVPRVPEVNVLGAVVWARNFVDCVV